MTKELIYIISTRNRLSIMQIGKKAFVMIKPRDYKKARIVMYEPSKKKK